MTLPPLNNNIHNPRFIFNTVAKLIQKPQSMSCPPFNVNDFLDFFCNKIDEIRTKINSSSLASLLKLIMKDHSADSQLVAHARQRHHVDQVTVTLDSCVISQSSTVTNLHVTFDSTLSFDQHIKEITKITFYHLCNIAKMI